MFLSSNKMLAAHEIARKYVFVKAKRQKQDYDGKSTLISYDPGYWVWYASEFKQLHIIPKLRSFPGSEGNW